MTPNMFADLLCEDLDIPKEVYSMMIAESMRSQIHEYLNSMVNEVPPEEDMRVTIYVMINLIF